MSPLSKKTIPSKIKTIKNSEAEKLVTKKPIAKKPVAKIVAASKLATKTPVAKKAPVKKVTSKKVPSSKVLAKNVIKKPLKIIKQAIEHIPLTKFKTKLDPTWWHLVIVESPAKAKTIQSFLGKWYTVMASMWHIVDLPTKSTGIDTSTFVVDYTVTKPDVMSKISKEARFSKKIWIATDEDREWEAIGWHVATALGLDIATTSRIVFHEITKPAITHAINHPRTIDMDLVNAQQSRRIVDRLVGYGISPVLRNKIKRWLSAWRVQSIAVKLLIEREKEIRAFVPQEYRTLEADLKTLKVTLSTINTKKVDKLNLSDYQDHQPILDLWSYKEIKQKNLQHLFEKNHHFELKTIVSKPWKKTPWAPFATSTLQQTASRVMWWSLKQVMASAQKLYENGLITYMRTDSTNLSTQALQDCKEYITTKYGASMHQHRVFKTKSKNAQEAHEAIRPTMISRTSLDANRSAWDMRLYELIRSRTVASQMSDASVQNTTYHFGYQPESVRSASWQTVTYLWFMSLYTDDEDDISTSLPVLQQGDILTSTSITAIQDFTKPPARYTEATLVKAMESRWIWRPSTYAPTITTIVDRWYVIKEEKKLVPTTIAESVTDYLNEHFVQMMDYEFTANLESQLDDIAWGKRDWLDVMKWFYVGLDKQIVAAQDSQRAVTYLDTLCPLCWSQLMIKHGGSWSFAWCSTYPECKHTQPLLEDAARIAPFVQKYEWLSCPAWGTLVVKNWRFGPYLVSSDISIKWIKSISAYELELQKSDYPDFECDVCRTGTMTLKKSRRWIFFGCTNYPQCSHTQNIEIKKVS